MNNNVLIRIEECIQSNDIDNAKSLISTNEKEFESNADFMNLKGVLCFNTGEIERAISCFSSALEIDFNHNDARENLEDARQHLLSHDVTDLFNLSDEEFVRNVINTIDNVTLKVESCIATINEGNISACILVLKSVQSAMNLYIEEIPRLRRIVDSNFMSNVFENILYCIEECIENYEQDRGGRLGLLVEFTLHSLLKELREEIYFFGLVYPNNDKMEDYYKYEFATANANKYAKKSLETEDYKYAVSILVPAYNKLEYTKQCVESIFKHTREFDYELILVNDGSSDGTKEYFENISYKNKKVISFSKNIGPTLAYLIGVRAAQGRVLATVSNDVIVTENWLKNLLICLESDESIGIVVPTTNNISNNQAISVSYESLKNMQEFAKKYNESNPDKWFERERLCPFLNVVPMSVYGQGLCPDRLFQFAEFSDDDFSLQLRLNGYKLILAKDTFCHHFGSVTLGEAQREINSLQISREIFKKKNRIDAWNDTQNHGLKLLGNAEFNEIKPVNILCIDPGLGMIPYRIKNIYKENDNLNVVVYNFSADKDYFNVSDEIYEHFISAENTADLIQLYKGKVFDYILFCKPFEEYENGDFLLIQIKELLSDSGELRFLITNPYNARGIVDLISINESIFGDTIFKKIISFVATKKLLSDGGYTNVSTVAIPSSSNQSVVNVVKKMVSCLNIETNGTHDLLYGSDAILFVVKA